MAYAPPSGNVTSTVDMFSWINGVVSNWFFPLMILALWVIMMIKMLTNPGNTVSKSFSAASFAMMMVSVMCRLLGFVDTAFMTIFILATVVGAIWMYCEDL